MKITLRNYYLFQVRKSRNDMMHSMNFNLQDQDKVRIITSFQEFLREPAFTDPKYNAKQVIDDMEKVKENKCRRERNSKI